MLLLAIIDLFNEIRNKLICFDICLETLLSDKYAPIRLWQILESLHVSKWTFPLNGLFVDGCIAENTDKLWIQIFFDLQMHY